MVETSRSSQKFYQNPTSDSADSILPRMPGRKYTLSAFARDHGISTGSAYQFGERVELEKIADLTPEDVEALLRYQDEIRTNGRHIKPGCGSLARELGVSRSAIHNNANTLGIQTKKPSLEDLDRIREYRKKYSKKDPQSR